MSATPSTSDLEKENSLPEPQSEESLGTQAEVKDLGPCKLKVTAEVAADKVAELLDKNYRDLINSLQIPGFRHRKGSPGGVAKRFLS